MTLEQYLKATAEDWLAEERLSEEQGRALERLVRGRARRGRARWLWGVAAVMAALLLVPALSPGARAWASATFPWLAQFIGRQMPMEPGWAWAEEHEMFQEVLAVARDKGYTFRVHRVLADAAVTTIFYSVEGPDPQPPNFSAGERDAFRFDGREFVRHWSGRGEVIDGVYVGAEEIDALPAERGRLTIDLQQIGDVQGRWRVSFPVTRAALTEQSRIVPVDRTIDFGGVPLQVVEVQLLPTRTVVHLRYEGPSPEPEIHGPGWVELIGPSGPIRHRGGSGDGTFPRDGQGSYDYTLEFDPLPPETDSVTLRMTGAVGVPEGLPLRVPLEPGAAAELEGAPAIGVRSVTAGRAMLESRYDPSFHPFDHWFVVGEGGEYHLVVPETSESGGLVTLTFRLDELPGGVRPVALEARKVMQPLEGWVEVPISLR